MSTRKPLNFGVIPPVQPQDRRRFNELVKVYRDANWEQGDAERQAARDIERGKLKYAGDSTAACEQGVENPSGKATGGSNGLFE